MRVSYVCRGAGEASSGTAAAAGPNQEAAAAAVDIQQQLMQLSLENRELKLRVAALMDAALPQDVRQELLTEMGPTAAAAAGATSSSQAGRFS